MSFDVSLRTLVAIIFVISTAALALAQEESDLSREAIEQAIRDATPEAGAFAAEIAARAEAWSAETRALTDRVFEAQTAAPPKGLDAILGEGASALPVAEARTAEPGPAGVLVFASFGMPEPALKQLILDARQAEVPVILRGFVGEGLGDTARRMHALLGGDDADADLLAGVLIDPRAYRVFQVTRVPTFLSTAHPLPDCDGLNCTAPAPAHDRIAGNLTLSGALRALAAEGEAAPLQARAALERLEAGP